MFELERKGATGLISSPRQQQPRKVMEEREPSESGSKAFSAAEVRAEVRK